MKAIVVTISLIFAACSTPTQPPPVRYAPEPAVTAAQPHNR